MLLLFQTELISHNPDFNSILNVDGEIFSVTQYESPRPGVAYVTELEQNKATGELTVWSDDEPDMLLLRGMVVGYLIKALACPDLLV